MFVVSPSIVQTIINFSSILVSSDRLRVAAPSLLIIWFANDRRLVVSVLLLFIFFVLVIVVVVVVVVGVPRRRRVENDGDEMTDGSFYINFFISSDMRLVI
jgi:heme/copper-type cytochrome/quinol oxidase subunit 2